MPYTRTAPITHSVDALREAALPAFAAFIPEPAAQVLPWVKLDFPVVDVPAGVFIPRPVKPAIATVDNEKEMGEAFLVFNSGEAATQVINGIVGKAINLLKLGSGQDIAPVAVAPSLFVTMFQSSP